ncbi:unnamed protein product, partial [Mesorhabditis belari]|uniref:Structure-specific endonuclease subunit SLX4 n=1 Tax=Mesorhabditis belari TaxID=2138241 RepID=A0AAF3FBH8_9BILA
MDDSFFDSFHVIPVDDTAEMAATSTANNGNSNTFTPKQKKPRFQFGSHIRVLKTHDVTPEPNFHLMEDKQLKVELAKNGLKPMGRKRAIKMLHDIYEHTHPIVDENLLKNLPSADEKKATKKKDQASENTKQKTEIGEEQDENGDTDDDPFEVEGKIPSNIDELHEAFICWLREPEQEELLLHCLQLKPVAFDELYLQIKKADSAICGMSKKALSEIMNRIPITFRALPRTRRGRKGKK